MATAVFNKQPALQGTASCRGGLSGRDTVSCVVDCSVANCVIVLREADQILLC